MNRKSRIKAKQIRLVSRFSKRGYSANRIQRELSRRHMGMRRTVLLRHVREFRGRQAKPSPEKYTRKKYRKVTSQLRFPTSKTIILRGRWKGEKKTIHRSGYGSQLYNFVRQEMAKARNREGWDARPEITSG